LPRLKTGFFRLGDAPRDSVISTGHGTNHTNTNRGRRSFIIYKLLINRQLVLYCSAEEWSEWTFGRSPSITPIPGANALKCDTGRAPRRVWGRGSSFVQLCV